MDHVDRRPREPWSLERERELQGRDPVRKRRLERSPDSSEHAPRRRHGTSLERSPGASSRDGGRRDSDGERPRPDRPSPARDRRGSLDRGPPEKRARLSPSELERERRRKAGSSGGGDSCKSPVKREDRSEHPSSSSSSKANLQSKQAPGGRPKLSQAWQGVLLLKNSSFPTSMHLLEGDLAVATGLLVEGSTGGAASQLKITQRLRLDQPKLDEVSRRIKAAGAGGHAVLLAVPGSGAEEGPQDVGSSTERPLKNLVSYLKQKQAAGVISLPVGGGGGSGGKEHAGVLHAFPPCEFSQQFLDASSKAFAKTEEDYLVMVVVRGAS